MKYETTFEGKPLKIIDSNVDQGRRTRAGVEGKDYEFSEIPESDYIICTTPDTICVLLRTSTAVQCTCEYFRKNQGMVCEHLLALQNLPKGDYEKAPNDIVVMLGETEGWTVNDAGKFTPPSKHVTPEVVAELPPESEEVPTSEQPTEKPAPKTGAKKPLCVATCQYCEIKIKASTQEKADERCANHEKLCKKRPADEPDVSKMETTENKTPVQATHDAPPEEKPTMKVATTIDTKPVKKAQPTPAAVAKDAEKLETFGEPAEQLPIPKSIAEAMCKMQMTELFAITDSDNPFFKSKYADLASIWSAIRKPLTENGLSVMQTTEPYEQGITVVTTLMHVSGETYATKLSAKADKQTIQALGSLITYLRRYSLAALVGVASLDDDGEAASGRDTKNKR
jgi:hypothetical protein